MVCGERGFHLGSATRHIHKRKPQEGEVVSPGVNPGPFPVDERRAAVGVAHHVSGGDVAMGETPSEP